MITKQLEALIRKHNADLVVHRCSIASDGFWAGLQSRAGINIAQARGTTLRETFRDLLADARKEAL
jgi:hypothetical protein